MIARIKAFICEHFNHKWVKVSSTREIDTFLCTRCGKQHNIKKRTLL